MKTLDARLAELGFSCDGTTLRGTGSVSCTFAHAPEGIRIVIPSGEMVLAQGISRMEIGDVRAPADASDV